jgi:MraZ protein
MAARSASAGTDPARDTAMTNAGMDIPSTADQGTGNPAATQEALPPLLLGTYTPRMDAKGRLALPAKFRSQLAGRFVLARGQERCVYLLPAGEFRRMAMRIQRVSVGNKATRDYLRVFLSGAVDEQADSKGRVMIPPMLRSYAHLDREIAVIGVGTRAEIWDKATWDAYLADREDDYSQIADDVLPEVDL